MIRRHISTTERVKIFTGARGVCGICAQAIRAGQAWDVEHRIPLAQGGDDYGANLYPAHRECHRVKTSRDAADTAKCKRREAAHIGAKAPSRNPLPGGRNSPWKIKMDGTRVPRNPKARTHAD